MREIPQWQIHEWEIFIKSIKNYISFMKTVDTIVKIVYCYSNNVRKDVDDMGFSLVGILLVIIQMLKSLRFFPLKLSENFEIV